MGKREIGELSIQDFVVSMLIAEIGALSIEKFNDSILLTFIPVVVLCILEVIMGKLFLKSDDIKKLIDGKPVLIINRGKINYKEMMRQKYNLDDLRNECGDCLYCKCNQLFTSNRQEGCVTVEDFYYLTPIGCLKKILIKKQMRKLKVF